MVIKTKIDWIKIPEKNLEISATLVTQKMWKEVMLLPQMKISLADKSYFKGENRPVDTVSLYEAKEFCNRLSKEIGEIIDLPTYKEWEYAAKANTHTTFYWGDEFSADLANFLESNINQTTEIKKYPPNAWGLYDVWGNVFEWCSPEFEQFDGVVMWEIEAPPERWVAPIRGGAWSSSYRKGTFLSVCGVYPHTTAWNGDWIAKSMGLRIVKRKR